MAKPIKHEFRLLIETDAIVPQSAVQADLINILNGHLDYYHNKNYKYKSVTLKRYRTGPVDNGHAKTDRVETPKDKVHGAKQA